MQGEGTNRHDSPKKTKKEKGMPPVFLKYITRITDVDGDGLLSGPESRNYISRYYRNLYLGDSQHITVAKGGKNSVLKKLLMRDALRRIKNKNENERTGWRFSRALGAGSYGEVTLWQKDLPGGKLVWCSNPRLHLINMLNWEQANLATKNHKFPIPFFRDYNNEGNAVRRLNDAGCKNVIELLDWVGSGNAMFCQVFEYAEFGAVHDVLEFYIEHEYFAASQA